MPNIQQLATALAARYRIERGLGAGGMATVYIAHDVRHNRKVALKVLRPELAESLGAERFLREIRIAAGLDHPHILTLIDSGETEGLLWYAVPYVRGESLRAWLDRDKQLSVEDALSVARQIASALDYAHRQGVIHRDVKPENILLHEREAMLADFGIALAVEEAGGSRVTATGIMVGTPQYSSPEQATGGRQVDARSDIYSLGAVVYEMLAGEPPHTGPTSQAVIARLLTEKPIRLRARRDSIPEGIDDAVTKALAKVPADRYASAGEFGAALTAAAQAPVSTRKTTSPRARWWRWPVTVAGVGIAVVVTLLLSDRAPSSAPTPTRRRFTFSGEASFPALAPDGRTIAYVERSCPPDGGACRQQLLVQDLAGGQAVPLASGNGINHPKWHPDGSSVLFQATRVAGTADTALGGAYLVPRLGGTPQRFAPSGAAAFSLNGDTIVLAASVNRYTVMARFLRTADREEFDSVTVPFVQGGLRDLDWSPDGKWLALLVYRGAGDRRVVLVSRRGIVTDSMTVAGRQLVRWVAAGDAVLLLLQGGSFDDIVFRQGIDRRTGRFTSDTVTKAQIPSGGATFDLSRDGTMLAFVSGTSTKTELVAIERDGERAISHKLSSFTGWSGLVAISPNGRQVAFARGDARGGNIYIIPFEGGAERALTSGHEHVDAPVWLRDGRLVFRKGLPSNQLFVVDLPGGRPRPFGPAGYTTGSPFYLQWVGDSMYALDQRDLHRVLIVDASGSTRDTVTVPDSLDQLLTATPDGRQLWFLDKDFAKGRFYSLDRATQLVKVAFDILPPYGALGWANGGAYLATWPRDRPSRPTLWRVNPGGAPTRVRELPVECDLGTLDMSRDGRRFVCKQTETKTDIFLLEGLDPGRSK